MNVVSFFIGVTVGGVFGVFTMAICACSKDEYSDSDEREFTNESKSKATK